MHADSVDTVIKRLETPPINLPPTLMNVLDCVCIMTHAIVDKNETRKLKEVVEIINVDSKGTAQTNQAFVWDAGKDQFYFSGKSHIFEKISNRFGLNPQEINNEFNKRVQLIYQMYQQNIVKFQEVQDIINEYHKKPEDVLQRFGVQ